MYLCVNYMSKFAAPSMLDLSGAGPKRPKIMRLHELNKTISMHLKK